MGTTGWKRFITVRRILLMASALLVVLALAVMWWDGFSRPYIENNFLYSADTVTSSSAYDVASQRYAGERYAKGTLSYEAESVSGGVAHVRATIKQHQVTGEQILTLARKWNLSTKTGIYLGESDGLKADTSGQQLFAPRNLREGESYIYRPVAYDAPATMNYVGRTQLYGLEVYHYAASFPANTRFEKPQTQSPPALPANENIMLQPAIDVWVEPVSGWLVKFEDDGQQLRFDRQSHTLLGPYSRYQTHYTDNSIQQQVAYARALKYRQQFAVNTVPAIIISTIIGGTLVYGIRRTRGILSVRVLALTSILICTIATIGWLFHAQPFMAVFIGQGAIDPLAILGFALATFGMLLIHWRMQRWTAIIAAAAVIAIGLGGLIGSGHGIGAIFDTATISGVTSYQTSRMSAFTAIIFILLGLSMLKMAVSSRPVAIRFASFGFGSVIILGTAGLLMQLLQIGQPLAIDFLGPFSAATSFLFTVSGYALLIIAQELHGTPATFQITARQLIRPALVCVPLLIIGLFAQFRQNIVQTELQTSFAADIAAIQSELNDRVELYNNTLAGTQALYASSQSVEPAEWHTFISSYNISQNLPGIRSIGFAKALTPQETAAFIAGQQKPGPPNYSIFPASTRPALAPIMYIEPQTPATQKELGYDLVTDAARSTALEQARDRNTPAVTGKIELGSIAGKRQSGVMVVAPVYANGQPTATLAQRQAALNGYVFADIAMDNFMQSLPTAQSLKLDFRIYDGAQTDSERLLYDSAAARGASLYIPRLSTSTTSYVLSHPITITYRMQPGFRLNNQQEHLPDLLLIGGGTTYLLLLAAGYLILTYRQQATRFMQWFTHKGMSGEK